MHKAGDVVMDAPELIKKLRAVVPFQGKSTVAFLCHEAADAIAAANAERDAAFALGVADSIRLRKLIKRLYNAANDDLDVIQFNRLMAETERELRAAAPVAPLQATLALPEVRGMREALNNIRKLNTAEPDGQGHRWVHSDLIDQEIHFALAKLEAKE